MEINADGTLNPLKQLIKVSSNISKRKAANRSDHLQDRMSEPHAHAIIVDPFKGNLAFVPDLGMDCIRMFA